VAELFAGSALKTPVLDGAPTAASALKMAYAGWTKGSAALLLTMRAAARAHGVEDALVREWEHSIPSLPDRSAQAARALADRLAAADEAYIRSGERPFAPLDEHRFGTRPTRHRLIDDPRARWPWLVV
jgi:hypothetical protein